MLSTHNKRCFLVQRNSQRVFSVRILPITLGSENLPKAATLFCRVPNKAILWEYLYCSSQPPFLRLYSFRSETLFRNRINSVTYITLCTSLVVIARLIR